MTEPLFTISQIAQHYGISVARVHQIVKARQIAPVMLLGCTQAFSMTQVHQMKPNRPGRPFKATTAQ